MAIAIFVGGCLFYWRGINIPAAKNRPDVNFFVSKGEGVKQIAGNLSAAGLIKSKFYFEAYVWQKNAESRFQAGEYALNPMLSIKEIVKILTKGEVAGREREIKIIEGWNINDIDKYLAENKIATAGGFAKLAKAKTGEWKPRIAKADFLADAPASATLEGYLFPDTYRVFKDATAADIIAKLLNNFGEKLTAEMKSEIRKQGKTIYEIITMASLLEKEVKTEEDMKIVSGIFWDRIKNGQPLESCATLAYILGVNKPQYSMEDTKIDSPYNTYQNRGLPPGPIANPGLKAIRAAIYPVFTDYNYFLSDPETGKTIFSKTYAEHTQNKVKYLR